MMTKFCLFFLMILPALLLGQEIVKTAFTIDKEGIAKDHYVKKGIGYGCDEECLWIIQSFAYYRTPAILNGEPEEVEYIFPIKFTLE